MWLDASTALPAKLAFDLRAAGGDAPRVSVEVRFSDFLSVGGIAYPHKIEKYLNGTLWATITIERVSFNTGLSDSDFAVAEVRP